MLLGVIFGAVLSSLLGLYLLGSIEERAYLYSDRTRVVLTFCVLVLTTILGFAVIRAFGGISLFDFLGG